MEQAIQMALSSGGFGLSALIFFRLAKLEKSFEKHNDTLVEVQKELAFMKGQGATIVPLERSKQ